MLEGIPLDVGNLSAIAILTLVVLMIITGKGLATRREVEAEKTRADSWHQAWRAAMEANRERDAQHGELLENSRTTVRILEAIQQQARGGDSP